MAGLEVVAAVLIRDGRALACRRAPHTADAGAWEFPGGKVETGERHEDALAREIREELGIEVAVGALVDRSEVPVGDRVIDLACYLADPVGELPVDEHRPRRAALGAARGARCARPGRRRTCPRCAGWCSGPSIRMPTGWSTSARHRRCRPRSRTRRPRDSRSCRSDMCDGRVRAGGGRAGGPRRGPRRAHASRSPARLSLDGRPRAARLIALLPPLRPRRA
ncbi:(deoxy)nucleoside triphosphate pyrophosphohydrolase [Clavibacter zhangzhiyongii]|uniref:(deoxy)nucleoside triphosphate pyrophosphohydrolase n=1 Tax=Clavibacter zhangzhiyongii TaxID=2768071 RepID=UPI0039E11BD2